MSLMNDYFGWLLDPAGEDQTLVLVVVDFNVDVSRQDDNWLPSFIL